MPFPHEFRQRDLPDPRCVDIDPGAAFRERPDETFVGDHVAETQARHHQLRERPEIDHASLAIERAQRGDHAVLVPELRSIVVFDDPGVVGSCPTHQFRSTFW